MLLAGAFKTGETARACLFVLPCILGVVASVPVEPRHLRLVTVALFAQATVMQWFGDSFW
jgi:predicted secreted protein